MVMQQTCIAHLLCAQHCVVCWGYIDGQDIHNCYLHRAYSLAWGPESSFGLLVTKQNLKKSVDSEIYTNA